MKTFALVVLLCVGATAADQPKHNGNWWTELSPPMKTAFVVGFYEGEVYTAVHFGKEEPFPIGDATFGQARDAVDAFYADPTNRLILVGYAIEYVSASIMGKPKTQEWLLTLRRTAAGVK